MMCLEKIPLRQRIQAHTGRRDYLMKIPIVKYIEEASSMTGSKYAAWAYDAKINPFMDNTKEEDEVTLTEVVCDAVRLCESRDLQDKEQGRRLLFELLVAPVYTINKET